MSVAQLFWPLMKLKSEWAKREGSGRSGGVDMLDRMLVDGRRPGRRELLEEGLRRLEGECELVGERTWEVWEIQSPSGTGGRRTVVRGEEDIAVVWAGWPVEEVRGGIMLGDWRNAPVDDEVYGGEGDMVASSFRKAICVNAHRKKYSRSLVSWDAITWSQGGLVVGVVRRPQQHLYNKTTKK